MIHCKSNLFKLFLIFVKRCKRYFFAVKTNEWIFLYCGVTFYFSVNCRTLSRALGWTERVTFPCEAGPLTTKHVVTEPLASLSFPSNETLYLCCYRRTYWELPKTCPSKMSLQGSAFFCKQWNVTKAYLNLRSCIFFVISLIVWKMFVFIKSTLITSNHVVSPFNFGTTKGCQYKICCIAEY